MSLGSQLSSWCSIGATTCVAVSLGAVTATAHGQLYHPLPLLIGQPITDTFSTQALPTG